MNTSVTTSVKYDLASLQATRSAEDDRWGVKQLPTFLGYGITLTRDELRVEMFTIIRAFRPGWRRITLMRKKEKPVRVVAYMDVATPGRWGDGVFRVRR